MRKLKYDIIEQMFLDKGFIILEYNEISSKTKIKCRDKLGYLYNTDYKSLKNNNLPQRFSKSNPYTIQNIKLWCVLNSKLFKLLSDIYENNSKKLKWKCLKEDCGEEFESNWNDIFSNKGCPFCAGKKVGLSNCLAIKRPDLEKEWHLTKNGSLTPLKVTTGSGKHIWWLCLKCGHEWKAIISERNRKDNKSTGCPECNKSKGEKECKRILISKYLMETLYEEYEILSDIDKNKYTYFISQKEFGGLLGLGNGLLSYDFYIPKLNLLIEYQGEQHEKYIPGFHKAYEDFEKQLEHDKRKREYAKKNNINLLEIWYWDFDNIEKILEKELNLII